MGDAALKRIGNEELKKLVTSPSRAADLIRSDMTVAVSGFTASGYPKLVPAALADRAKNEKDLKISLLSGASLGPELDGCLARAGVIGRRMPYQTDKDVRSGINSGKIDYADIHLSQSGQQFKMGGYDDIDIAVIEAAAILKDGSIVTTTSIGNTPFFIKSAKQLIIEVNTSVPMELVEMTDIYEVEDYPGRKPIGITSPCEKIGTKSVKCDTGKITAIVMSDIVDSTRGFAEPDEISNRISENVLAFFDKECAEGRLSKNLLPIQSGVGSIANAVLYGLCNSKFENLTCYTEVIQDSMLELLNCGKASCLSATAISPSSENLRKFYKNISFYKDKIVLRPQDISNNPEVIRRLGIIAMNTAVEADIYGNINSTHIRGTKMINGIGGSGDFARNAAISIFLTPSTAKGGDISSIVPMVSHVDHTEHDVMVIVTEQGYADLRCLSPKERAVNIIDNCAHPDYKEQLRSYFLRACESNDRHTPHILEEALSWHIKSKNTGSMK